MTWPLGEARDGAAGPPKGQGTPVSVGRQDPDRTKDSARAIWAAGRGGFGDHFDTAADLATVFNLQAPAAGGADHLAGAAHDQIGAGGHRAVDGTGDLGVFHLHLAFEHTTGCHREFVGMEELRLDRAFNHEAFRILNQALQTDAAADHQGTPLLPWGWRGSARLAAGAVSARRLQPALRNGRRGWAGGPR